MIVGLDHISIAVPSLESAIQRFAEDFSCKLEGVEEVAEAQTVTAFFEIAGTKIELVHPMGEQGPIAKYLRKHRGGLHHLCFRSDDIEQDIADLKAKGYEFVNESPQPGAHGSRVVFIHPRSCDGVLIEIAQHADDAVNS